MILAVHQGCLDVHQRIARPAAGLHGLADALLDRLDELLRNGPADDLVVEDEVGLDGRPQTDLDVAVLAAATTLVLFHAIPQRVSFQATTLVTILSALRNGRLMLAVTFTATIMTAVYIVFTYFGPLIEASAGSNPETRTFYLVLFGIGAVIGNYAGGILTDRYLKGLPPDSRWGKRGEDGHRWWEDQKAKGVWDKVEALTQIANERGQTLAQMALAWILRLPGITSALIGASSVEQVRQDLKALDNLDFSPEELSRIDALTL